jgi:hypothetical protein
VHGHELVTPPDEDHQHNDVAGLVCPETAGRGWNGTVYGREEMTCAPFTIRLVAGLRLR